MRQALKRKAVPAPVGRRARTETIVAPVRGWISAANRAAAPKQSAVLLENFFPTTTGIRLGGTSTLKATIGTDPVESMFVYRSGSTEKLFAADENNIFDITTVADPEVAPTADVTGQTSGYYSAVPFTTAAGSFLTVFNGDDAPQIYNGTVWLPITATAVYALAYDAESAAFTVGETVTGGTSGATGVIVRVADDGSTGTLYINALSGNFQNDETITDGASGSATANGTEGSALIGAITGITTSTLSQGWVYRNRQYMVEGGTQSAWYLGSGAFTGAATEISLAGVFKRGGALLFGATWSLDAGDGVDDKCVFVSTEGEVAVYEGSYPGGSDWNLIGRYDMPKPMGKNGTVQAGGDLIILTEMGAVPLSAVQTKDPAALEAVSVSRNISPDWRTAAIARRSLPWEMVKWPTQNFMLVTLPKTSSTDEEFCFVVNSLTGAWTKYTWQTRCATLYDDWIYFATNDGTVHQAEVGGDHSGANVYHRFSGHAEHFGAIGAYKTVIQCRAQFVSSVPFTPKLSVSMDYEIAFPTAPDAADTGTANEWDVGLWDVALWDQSAVGSFSTTRWVSVGQSGIVVQPQVQITSGSTRTPDTEMVSFDVLLEHGAAVI